MVKNKVIVKILISDKEFNNQILMIDTTIRSSTPCALT